MGEELGQGERERSLAKLKCLKMQAYAPLSPHLFLGQHMGLLVRGRGANNITKYLID